MFGFININKQSGMTSHKVISVLRRITGIKQIGHAGTLDPMASGVLPVAIGKAAKLIDFLPEDKSYEVSMLLGKISDTFDTEGTVTETGYRKVTEEEVKSAVEKFKGGLIQIPPAFSAVHYNGKRLYELARNGKIPNDIPSRKIFVYKNEITGFDYQNQVLKLCISCSKGTYIRSIVNDLGKMLNSGAVMSELTRTVSSGMRINESLTIDENTAADTILNHLINPLEIIKLPKVEINDEIYKKLINGNAFKNSEGLKGNVLIVKDNKVLAYGTADGIHIQPKKVLL